MQRTVAVSVGSSAWRIVSTDGNLYTDLAALLTAGKTPFPGGDPGMFPTQLMIRSRTAAHADGGNFLVATNLATAPADTAAMVVDGAGGQTLVLPGVSPVSVVHIVNVWIKPVTGTDYMVITAEY